MNTEILEKHFDRMGVRIKITRPEPTHRPWWTDVSIEDYSLDIRRDRNGEHFVLNLPKSLENKLEIDILQSKPKERHLLLMARKVGDSEIDRFLCGHDEREWFVAAVPGAVSTVDAAKESLKPWLVKAVQARKGLKANERNRRKNRAFKRQGEWFFVPVTDIIIDENLIFHNEPIARSGGKPHIVQFLHRFGGTLLHVCHQYPNGISSSRYHKILRQRPEAKGWGWQTRSVNPRVFARGEIRHPDHKTIKLHDWHEVLMNTENKSRTMRNVAFID
ncbi:MAG: hypothetical protein AAGA58_16965 [Verrucomicrobiota bacterium]